MLPDKKMAYFLWITSRQHIQQGQGGAGGGQWHERQRQGGQGQEDGLLSLITSRQWSIFVDSKCSSHV